MARNDGVDRTTVRNQPRTESNIADAEAHNERQKACYRNEDIVPERSHMNIHFKTPSGSYQEMFRQMEQDGTISTRGLKQDAVHYGELVFDVWHCSECDYCIDDGTDDPERLPKYCPGCGALMDGGNGNG